MSEIVKTILVPTDLTENGNVAVETATSFCKSLKAKLILMHVVDLPAYPGVLLEGDIRNPGEMAIGFAQDQLKLISSDQMFEDIEVEVCVESGKVFQSIVKKAEKSSCDLIVMGAHGLTGLEHLLLGTNARRVIHSTSIPVLTVKEPLYFENIQKIAFASNFNQEYAYSFPRIYQYVEMFNPQINLVKVITPKNFESSAFSMKTIDDFAASVNLMDYQSHLVNAHSVPEGLAWYCANNAIDLLFMPTHGQTGITRIWSGSHAERMGQQSTVPIFSHRMIDIAKSRGVIFPD
jgi:nucleotide-binding universal stress UspA family protein